MGSPRFTDTLEIGIVVRDVEATMRRYVDNYEGGPGELHEFDSHNVHEFRGHAEPVDCAWRIATMVGQVAWGLIQPLDDRNGYTRFLAGQGEDVHHLAVAVPSRDEEGTAHFEAGEDLALSCRLKDARIAYRLTDRALGVFLESFGSPSNLRGA